MSEHFLMTGFPGFIAQALVKELTHKKPAARFTFLVHSSMMVLAKKILDGSESENIRKSTLIESDITLPNLGLHGEHIRSLASSVTKIFHLAAVYDLTVPQSVGWKINVEGTQNVLDLIERHLFGKAFNRLVYFSTCYVAGKRKGQIYEEECVSGHGFLNYYEETKFEAELRVRACMSRIPTTMIRPAVVTGDSKTGWIPKFDGPYYIMRFFMKWPLLGRLCPSLGYDHTRFNSVPVDFLVQVVTEAAFDDQCKGKCLQVADPNPPSTRQTYELIVELITGKHPWRFDLIRGPLLWALSLKPFAWFTGIPKQAIAYFWHEGFFDCKNTLEVCRRHNIPIPIYTDVFPVIYRFLQERPSHEK